MKKALTGAALLLSLLASASAFAQERSLQEVAVAVASAERKAIIADRMQLDEEESREFWPIYNEYLDAHQALDEKLGELLRTLAREFETLDDETADRLLEDYHEFREERLALRWKTARKLRKKFGAKRAGRFYQIENKLDTMTDMELVKAVPLVR